MIRASRIASQQFVSILLLLSNDRQNRHHQQQCNLLVDIVEKEWKATMIQQSFNKNAKINVESDVESDVESLLSDNMWPMCLIVKLLLQDESSPLLR